jgi:hypothetical protein
MGGTEGGGLTGPEKAGEDWNQFELGATIDLKLRSTEYQKCLPLRLDFPRPLPRAICHPSPSKSLLFCI